MRCASLVGFGGRIALSSGAIEPVERFLIATPDTRRPGPPSAPRSPWGPPMGSGLVPQFSLTTSALGFSP